jgi:hypothetical protein
VAIALDIGRDVFDVDCRAGDRGPSLVLDRAGNLSGLNLGKACSAGKNAIAANNANLFRKKSITSSQWINEGATSCRRNWMFAASIGAFGRRILYGMAIFSCYLPLST